MRVLLDAGYAAPSARNEQTWHFVVLRERAVLEAVPRFHRNAAMLREAAAAICVCSDRRLEKDPEAEYWVQNCAAAAENILLAAQALGLGACWLGIHPRAERKGGLRALLHLPEHVEPFCLIALGYPAEDKGAAARCPADRIHHDRW